MAAAVVGFEWVDEVRAFLIHVGVLIPDGGIEAWPIDVEFWGVSAAASWEVSWPTCPPVSAGSSAKRSRISRARLRYSTAMAGCWRQPAASTTPAWCWRGDEHHIVIPGNGCPVAVGVAVVAVVAVGAEIDVAKEAVHRGEAEEGL